MYYIGLDVHKKAIGCCVKDASGFVLTGHTEAIHSARIAACRACAQTFFSLPIHVVNDNGRYRQP
jgi:hypothetical protein